MNYIQSQIYKKVRSDAKILLFVAPISLIIGFIIYSTSEYETRRNVFLIAGIVIAIVSLFLGLRDINPKRNPIFKALISDPKKIKDITLVTHYLNEKDLEKKSISKYSVDISLGKSEVISFSFGKNESEKALKFRNQLAESLQELINESSNTNH